MTPTVMTVMTVPAMGDSFDHQHAAWDRLLTKHVKWISGGSASQVDYGGFKKDRQDLKKYLDDLSSVNQQAFDTWTRDQRLAFLINAYNAFTVELILTRYPDLESIRDLGSFFSSPWKKRFFVLLGARRHLDEIEHEMIRKPGVYDEPRIHFAVVCAAIGCPGIRNEAFTADRLDAQLEDSLKRFLSDRSRNRFNDREDRIEVSKIFKWYRVDFEPGRGPFSSLENFFSKYAKTLTQNESHREKIKTRKVDIHFLDYDWKLNDLSR